MINKERIEMVLDQINDLLTLVQGFDECGDSVPAFLIKMCDEKLEKVSRNVHLLANEKNQESVSTLSIIQEIPIEVIDEPIAQIDPPIKEEVIEDVVVEPEPIVTMSFLVEPDQPSKEESVVQDQLIDEDDYDRFIQNLKQTTGIQEPNKNNDRTVLGERFESQVLHEKIAAGSSGRVVEQMMGKQMQVDLNKSISLNDKFRFQRELFNGNGAKMAEIFNKLNQFTTLIETMQYIGKNFSWDDSNDSVKYFYSILEKRFNA